MEFETLKKSYKKEIIIGIVVLVVIGITLLVKSTFAKYELVKNIKIAEGTINYKVPDFKIMAIYKNDGNGDVEIETMPESGYAINEDKSYCNINDKKDSNAKLYTDEDGQHIISKITKGSRCYLYFDNYKKVNTALGEITVKLATPDFSKTSCSEGCEESTVGIYQAKDDDGMSYYYRGDVENNYVKFGEFYWRIIRINGDGSIRLIYDGTSAHQNGEKTDDSIAIEKVKFSHKDAYYTSQSDNAYTNNNAYVGFKYTLSEVHGLGTKSNALQELEKWYTDNLSSYTSKIDNNAGFCGDRTSYTDENGTNLGGGIGTTTTYYGVYIRLITNKSPVLTCLKEDMYTTSSSTKGNKSLTYPIGLITADEASMAGGSTSQDNYNYYLFNEQAYWTMSPKNNIDNHANLFVIGKAGNIFSHPANNLPNIRPVINLRSDTKFTFTSTEKKGTTTNPYIVE